MTRAARTGSTPASEGSPGRSRPTGTALSCFPTGAVRGFEPGPLRDRPTWWLNPDHADPDTTPVCSGTRCPGNLEHCHGTEVRHGDGWRECLAVHPCTAAGGVHGASVPCTEVADSRLLDLRCPCCEPADGGTG
jgi:hypothetical protein